MNNPINAPQSPNELVLRLIGGERDGQLITIENEKCLLSDLSHSIKDAENYRCVIFRGEKGVAFRSYSDHVLCNGAKVSVQWLKKGDLIKVTDSFSVEVYQLGVYSKKTGSAPTTSRAPVNTVEVPGKVAPAPSSYTPVTRPVAKTIESSSPAAITPPTPATSGSGTKAPTTDYTKPSVEFPSVSSSSTGEAPKFKPATAGLRTPTVTAPLPSHTIPTESPSTVPSVSRMPVHTQAMDAVSTETSDRPENEVEDQSVNSLASTEAPPVTPLAGVPSPPSNSTIESLSERLSKLVNSAGSDGNSDFEDSESPETTSSIRPPAATMQIEPTIFEPANNGTEAKQEAPAQQSPAEAKPEQSSISTPDTGRVPAQTIEVTPVVEATNADSPTGDAPQTTTSDSAAHRRSALESYFSKSGISLSDTITPPEDVVASAAPVSPANPVSPEATPVEPAAPIASSASVESAVPAPTEQPSETVAAEAVPASPEFDLDSVLANLESGSSTPSSQTPAVEPSQEEQPPVAAASVFETPVAETPVAETPVFATPVVETPVLETPVVATPAVETPAVETPAVENAFEQPPVATDNQDETSSETTNGDQGGQLESFALLQSLGLDTSGLRQIKKEITDSPSSTDVESIAADTQPQAEPEASEPQASEPQASEPAKVESVADVLARMQNAGSLQDFKAGEEEAESAAAGITQQEAPAPPPATPPVASAESSIASDDVGGTTAEGSGAAEDDGSVENYMSQLLNRMRGDEEPTSGEVAEQKQDQAAEKIAAEQQITASPTQPEKVGTLTQEEFIPKQKAVRMQSLDSLRELANTNAREAFRDSLAKERKVNTQTKLTLALVSLGFGFLFFVLSFIMAATINFWGVAFGLAFLLIGLYTMRAYLSERKLDESILSD